MNLLDLSVKISVDTGDTEEKIKGVEDDVEELGEKGEETSEKLGAADQAIGNLISDMAKWGVKALANMAKTGVMYNAQIETYTAALTTALGSEAAAAEAIEQIKVDAARTPYDVDGLVSANTKLIQAGESAESARETVLALTDAISASGGDNAELQRLAQNLQQIKANGKAAEIDIRQFGNAGIDLWSLLEEYTGRTRQEIKETGATYELITGAIMNAAAEGGRFYEANARQAETLNGQLSTLGDNWNTTLGNAFSGLAELLSGTILPATNEFLESLDPSDATVLMIELAAGVAGVGIAAIAANDGAGKLLKTLKAMGTASLAAGAAIAITTAVMDNIKTMEEYTNSLVVTDGAVEDMAANLEVLRQKEAELKAQMDSGWGSEDTIREYDMVRNAIALQTQAQEDAIAAAQAAADAQSDITDSTEDATEAMSEQQTQLQGLAASYIETFRAAQAEVQGYFKMFEKADKIQAASLSDMKNNIQSQIDFNNQYQQSLQTLADNGYGELAEQVQSMGEAGAEYALALSQAIDKGNTEEVQGISTMLNTLNESQSALADTMTNVDGQFNTLLEAITTGTETPYQIVLEDNAAEVAEGVNASLDTIADVTVKYIDIVTRYTEQGNPNAEPNSSNAQGLEYVPFDNYIINAHRGETLLTASEAKDWRESRGYAPDPNVERILVVLEQIAANGLDARVDSRSLYKAISNENRVRAKATGYNPLSMT